MAEAVMVSGRGQITIPAGMRKSLGIEAGGTMTIEETSEGILLKPCIQISVDFESYSDDEIAAWDENDSLSQAERERLVALLGASAEKTDE
jgi:AbrB family looped-hinge helix DNA binding protein